LEADDDDAVDTFDADDNDAVDAFDAFEADDDGDASDEFEAGDELEALCIPTVAGPPITGVIAADLLEDDEAGAGDDEELDASGATVKGIAGGTESAPGSGNMVVCLVIPGALEDFATGVKVEIVPTEEAEFLGLPPDSRTSLGMHTPTHSFFP